VLSLEKLKQDILNIQCLLEDTYSITQLLIFGSYANNSAKSLSDLDIGIFSSKELDILEFGMLVSDLEKVTDQKIDLVVLNDLYKKNAKLSFNILQNHKLVFSNNKKEYIDFKSNTMQYYFDIEPMYKMFDRELKQRLKSGTYGKI
jgi:predicted nucleotidyltransferase